MGFRVEDLGVGLRVYEGFVRDDELKGLGCKSNFVQGLRGFPAQKEPRFRH